MSDTKLFRAVKASERLPGISMYYFVRHDQEGALLYCGSKDSIKNLCYNKKWSLKRVEWLEPIEEKEYAEQQTAGMREALKEIINPVKYMQNRLQKGEQLNGPMAIKLANSGSYLREIAEKALGTQGASKHKDPKEDYGRAM